MERTAVISPEEDLFVLSNLSPSPAQKRLALFVVLCILAVFVLITAGLFSNFRPVQIEAFLPGLYGGDDRKRCDHRVHALRPVLNSTLACHLLIASGYLFTALILIPWVLTIPGGIAPRGLIGGFQSTSGLYLFWHAGFAFLVIGYALSKDADPSRRYWQGTVRAAIALSIALTVARCRRSGISLHTGRATIAHRDAAIPVILRPLWPYVVGAPVALAIRLPPSSCSGFDDTLCSIFG